jgi:hypothetical protein
MQSEMLNYQAEFLKERWHTKIYVTHSVYQTSDSRSHFYRHVGYLEILLCLNSLVLAAGLADRHQPLEETAMFVSPKRKHKSSMENKVVVRNISLCGGVYRETGRKEGAKIWVCLPLCLMREVACLSESVLCFIGSALVLC